MQAIVFEQFGPPADVLHIQQIDTPNARPGQVRVRMLASPINPSDLLTIRGSYGKLPTLPATPGFEGVGIVDSSGGGLLGKYLVGKRVCVLNRESGNWCEKTVVPAQQAIALPSDLPLEQAAMFFVNPAAAYVMVRKVLCIQPGQWLLQTAAASALGRMVIRLGRRFGFQTVNVVRRSEQVQPLEEIGADRVLVFDPQAHAQQQLCEQVRDATGNQPIVYAMDPVGGATGSALVDCLAPRGRLLVYGTLTDDPLSFSPRVLMKAGAAVEGFWLAPWMARQKLLAKLRLVRSITRLIQQGVLVSEVGQTFRLDQITDAVRAAETRGRNGKILLRIGGD